VQSESSVTVWAITSAIAGAFVIYRHWRRDRSVGLLLTYVLSFAALHWLASALRMLPWFVPRNGDLTLQLTRFGNEKPNKYIFRFTP